MLQIATIRQNKSGVLDGLRKRNLQPEDTVDKILATDDERKWLQTQLDQSLARQNQLAKEIGMLFKNGQTAEAESKKAETHYLKEQSKSIEIKLAEAEEQLLELLYLLPNVPHSSIPAGKSANENEEVERWGEMPSFPAQALPHWDLCQKYGLVDFELGVKVSGAGFPFYIGKGARLQRALINFFLDEAIAAGYREYQAPLLVNRDSGIGTGQLPDKDGQMYYAPADDLYLIPTAEVPITNIFRNEILELNQLPVKCCGYTPCFRREAGSYGKDVRGLNRLHQFDKVEIVQIAHPEQSYEILEEMRKHVTGILQKLGLHYRVLKLCGGDMGFASAFTYDMEVYSGAQQRWLEVSSTSNFETFQANRLKLRFRDENKKTRLAHTLNGSALALPRIVAALLENNQTENGIKVPEVLHAYTGFSVID